MEDPIAAELKAHEDRNKRRCSKCNKGLPPDYPEGWPRCKNCLPIWAV